MALCAAEFPAKEGDVYIDDVQDHALRDKYLADYESEGLIDGARNRKLEAEVQHLKNTMTGLRKIKDGLVAERDTAKAQVKGGDDANARQVERICDLEAELATGREAMSIGTKLWQSNLDKARAENVRLRIALAVIKDKGAEPCPKIT